MQHLITEQALLQEIANEAKAHGFKESIRML